MPNSLRKRFQTGIEKCHKISIEEIYSYEPELFVEKVTVVVGGTGDIGSTITERLLSQGGRVVITGRQKPNFALGGDCPKT